MNKKIISLLIIAILIVGAGFVFLYTHDEPRADGDAVKLVNKAAADIRKEVLTEKERIRIEKEKAREKKEREKREKAEAEKAKKDIAIEQNIVEEFIHGDKGKEYQKYIVLHDTEGGSDAYNIIQSWVNQGKKVASHFIINKDGTVVQCVPMDKIAHHAGFGNNGHNEKYGVTDESRDDRAGTESIGADYSDYGMNSYSIGIEMIHNGSSGEEYPEAQLEALDKLIAYIDNYYGNESTIMDHKMWRTSNSDTSSEFAGYLQNYMSKRRHE